MIGVEASPARIAYQDFLSLWKDMVRGFKLLLKTTEVSAVQTWAVRTGQGPNCITR